MVARAGRPRRKKPVVIRTRTKLPEGIKGRAISVRFPVGYLRIIEAEATQCGMTRSQFLSMLVNREQGRMSVERSTAAPSHHVTEEDLKKLAVYYWLIPYDVRNAIDRARLRMGNLTIAQYLAQLINHWIGQPKGLVLRGDTK